MSEATDILNYFRAYIIDARDVVVPSAPVPRQLASTVAVDPSVTYYRQYLARV